MRNAILDVTASVAAKIAGIVIAFAAMTATAVALSFMVFSDTAKQIETLAVEKVGVLRNSDALLSKLARLEATFLNMLVAHSEEELWVARDEMAAAIRETRASLAAVGTAIPDAAPRINTIETQLLQLMEARSKEFARGKYVAENVDTLNKTSQSAGQTIGLLSSARYDALIAGSENTVDSVSSTFDRLINDDFASVQLALSARVALNTLAGVALALNNATDPVLTDILQDNKATALASIRSFIEESGRFPALAEAAWPMEMVLETVTRIERAANKPPVRLELVDQLRALDAMFIILQDNLLAELEIAAADAASTNEQSIVGLVSDQVEPMRALALLEISAQQVVSGVLEVAFASNPDKLEAALARLAAPAAALAVQRETVPEEIQVLVDELIRLADPKGGIAPDQLAMLSAKAEAERIAVISAIRVADISADARSNADATLSAIVVSSEGILEATSTSITQLGAITIASLVLSIIAPGIAWLTIVRPLARAATATSKLAGGDMRAVDGLRAGRGEIGRMVSALGVFRDSLVEKARLEEEERTNQALRAEAEARAAKEAADQEERERMRLQAEEVRERERAAAQEAERARARDAAELERQKMLDIQNHVVNSLADGLRKLAAGDLVAQIDKPFDAGYEQLRLDFNEAVATLRNVLTEILSSADSINSDSANIAQAADDLSRRTENTAATLEQSAAALTELTSSVASAADRSSEADHIVRSADKQTEPTNRIVMNAVAAMEAIRESSSKISSIINLIDDIAFQTNLLALNAGVEAARAGDAGRGFAVVASEVRALAQRSSEAAQEIGTLISESGNEVKRGVEMVGQAGVALKGLMRSITDISGQVSAIAAAAREQAMGISEINGAVNELEQTTQQNAAMVEETTAAGQALSQEATRLISLLGQFSLNGEDDEEEVVELERAQA